jgi:hypothetical protein
MADPGDDFWLFRVGATSPAYWSAVVELQLRRLEEGIAAHTARRDHPARGPNSFADGFSASLMHSFGPMQADAYFLLVAVRHVLAIADRAAAHLDLAPTRAAIVRFQREVPDAKDLRDVTAHLDEYATGGGKLKDRGIQGHGMIQVGTDAVMRAGELKVDLRRAANAAVDLARTVNSAIPEGGVRIIPRTD